MKQPASIVLFKHLASLGLFTEPSDAKPWPCFVSFMPDEKKYNNAVCIYDTQPFQEGRNMRAGTFVEKPGIQIKVRASDYTTGWSKMNAIVEALNAALRLRFDCGNYIYDLQCVNNQPIIPLGIEPDNTERRQLFVVNCLVSVIEDDVHAAVDAFHQLVHVTMPTNMALLP